MSKNNNKPKLADKVKANLAEGASIAAIGGGVGALQVNGDKWAHQIHSDKLLGYHKMYHGTSRSNAAEVKKHGLKVSKFGNGVAGTDLKPVNLSEFKYTSPKDIKGKVFMSPDRTYADRYSRIAHQTQRLAKGSGYNPIHAELGVGPQGGHTLKAKIPHHVMQRSRPDHIIVKEMALQVPEGQRPRASDVKLALKEGGKKSRSWKHDIPSKYFEGGAKMPLKEKAKNLVKYYGSSSGRRRAAGSLKAVGKIGASLGTIAGGIALAHKSVDMKKKLREGNKR